MKRLALLMMTAILANAESSFYERGELTQLEKITSSRSADNSGIEYYKTQNGQKVGITDEILVKCKSGIDCNALLAKFNLTDISNVTETILLVKIKEYDDIFSVCRELFESEKVEFAHPNFIKQRRLR